MRLLAEIHRHPNLNLAGRTITRNSVKAIIPDGRKLLLVYSAKFGAYKYPGGGIKTGEMDVQALARELQEECGAQVLEVGEAFGMVIEYALPEEPEYDLFKHISSYYHCTIIPELRPQHLDLYEIELGLTPVWVAIDQAIDTNRKTLTSGLPDIPNWTARDTLVLEWVRQQLIRL